MVRDVTDEQRSRRLIYDVIEFCLMMIYNISMSS